MLVATIIKSLWIQASQTTPFHTHKVIWKKNCRPLFSWEIQTINLDAITDKRESDLLTAACQVQLG